MTACSRREFGRIVVASVPLAALAGSRRVVAAGGVLLGATSSSFRDLPRVTGRDNVEDILRAMRSAGVSTIELSMSNVEPAPPTTAPFLGGSAAYPRRVVLSAEEIASTNKVARAALREWRLSTPTSHFEQLRQTFASAGIRVHACALTYDDSFTDAEIDATLRQVNALGVATASSALTMPMAKRLAPFAERHGVAIAIHNQLDGNAAGTIATPDLDAVLALSPAFTLKLDVGNLTASDRDAVAELGTRQSRVAYVLMRDRLHHGGVSQPFGDGDTPITAVLQALKTTAAPIPALVEYDYPGLRSSAEEVAGALAYLTRAIV